MKFLSRSLAGSLGLALAALALTWALPVKAQDLAAAKSCNAGAAAEAAGIKTVGDAYVASSNVPDAVKGATTVSPMEAQCLIDALRDRLLVLQVMTDERQLPRAQAVPEFGSTNDGEEQRLAERLVQLTGGNKSKPMLFYCHHDRCQLSYNATVRAARAGYTNVFWMKAGQSGWQNTGLAFKNEEVGKTGHPVRVEKAVNDCVRDGVGIDQYVGLVYRSASDAALRTSFQEAVAREKRVALACLDNAGSRYRDNRKLVAWIEQAKSRADSDLEQRSNQARDAFEANPALVQPALDKLELADARTTISTARNYRPLAQLCRAPSQMPNNQAQLDDINAQMQVYIACMTRVEDGLRGETPLPAAAFEQIVTRLEALGRYSCTQRPGAKCIPATSWSRVADVYSRGNLAVVAQAAQVQASRRDDIRRAVADFNAYVGRVNQRVDDSNNRPARSSGGGSYSAPSYQPPPSTPIRRDSSTSAPGMR
jgi:rhodanese-related sulfurtransferase